MSMSADLKVYLAHLPSILCRCLGANRLAPWPERHHFSGAHTAQPGSLLWGRSVENRSELKIREPTQFPFAKCVCVGRGYVRGTLRWEGGG